MPHLQMHARGAQDLVFVRHFDAPPERLFQRFTDPAWIRRWLGSRERPLTDVSFEARPGGRLHSLWDGPEGPMELRGEVLEIAAPGLIRHSARFTPDWTDGPAEVLTRFAPEGPGCQMTLRIRYVSVEVRDRVMDLPVAEGLEQAFVKLDQMLCP